MDQSEQVELPVGTRSNKPISTDPLLVTAKQAAAMCGKSLRTWRTWDAAGLIPRPRRIGRSVCWDFAELKDWIANGCQRRSEWEARQ